MRCGVTIPFFLEEAEEEEQALGFLRRGAATDIPNPTMAEAELVLDDHVLREDDMKITLFLDQNGDGEFQRSEGDRTVTIAVDGDSLDPCRAEFLGAYCLDDETDNIVVFVGLAQLQNGTNPVDPWWNLIGE